MASDAKGTGGELEIIIEPDGRVSIFVKKVTGSRCLDLTRDIEASLSDEIESRTLTSDYYESHGESATESEHLKIGQEP